MRNNILTIIILILWNSFSSFACKCAILEMTPDIYFQYDIIFIGHLDTILSEDMEPEKRIISFYCDKLFKGIFSEKVNFKNISTGSCSGTYKKGIQYLIYLRLNENEIFYTTTCLSKSIRSKESYINTISQFDTTRNYDALKYRELDFLEKYKSISNGNFVVNLPNGKICVSGEIENSLPVGKWMFYDFNGVFNKSINYRRGKKFRKK